MQCGAAFTEVPIASTGAKPYLTINEADWQRIEDAYGEQLTGSVRTAIVNATQEFVDWESFERTAEPIAKTQS